MRQSESNGAGKKQRNWEPDPSKPSKEERALNFFAEAMISKIEQVQKDWQKPWFTANANRPPQNLSGRNYNGMNSIILMIQSERKGYQLPVWLTHDRAASLNYAKDKQGKTSAATDSEGNKLPTVGVRKGEKSTPVFIPLFTVVNPETKEKISYEEYRKLEESEKAKYNVYPKLQVYNVFNIDQTNIKEARPELYDKLLEKYGQKESEGQEAAKEYKASVKAIDALIDNDLWLCPIKQIYVDDASYSPSLDHIVVPERKQFKDGESFATTTLHEMAHSTGAAHRLGRIKATFFGDKEYAREELVAELTAAFVASKNGMEKHPSDEAPGYLRSWLDAIKADPKFIKTILLDVKRAENVISQRIDQVSMELRKGEKSDFALIRDRRDPFADNPRVQQHSEEVSSDKTREESDDERSEEDKEKTVTNGVDSDLDGEVETEESVEEKKKVETVKSGHKR